MNINKIHSVYFSATGTTKAIVNSVAKGTDLDLEKEYNLLQGLQDDVYFSEDDLVIFGAPVYSGRIPAVSVDSFQQFKGKATLAICVVVYGNREYEDALLELKNIVENNGFKVISAAAFVAEHSIFPEVAHGRPDAQDKIDAEIFGKKSLTLRTEWGSGGVFPDIKVKGNFPYRETKGVPLKPKGNRRCNKCGACVKVCPAGAISTAHPRKTDKSLCISCAHCIKICPQDARHFGGLLYKLVGKKFFSAYGKTRKEPEFFFGEK